MRRIPILVVCAAACTLALAGTGFAAPDGAQLYQKCFGCHKNTGVGIPGVFPPLAGNAGKIAAAPAGRTYLVDALLYGLEGPIRVDGKDYDGKMPGFGAQFKDDEVAAVLNHVLGSWGNETLLPKGHQAIGAAEVKARRAKKLSPKQVHEARQKLGLK